MNIKFKSITKVDHPHYQLQFRFKQNSSPPPSSTFIQKKKHNRIENKTRKWILFIYKTHPKLMLLFWIFPVWVCMLLSCHLSKSRWCSCYNVSDPRKKNTTQTECHLKFVFNHAMWSHIFSCFVFIFIIHSHEF